MKTKYFKTKVGEGEFSEEIYFAVDSDNVELTDGSSLTNKITEMEAAISNNKNTINTLDSAVASINTQIGGQASQISTLTTKTSNLESSLKESNDAITNLQTSVNNLNSKTNTMEGTISINSSEIAAAKTSIENLDNDISDIHDVLATSCILKSTSLTCTLPDNL